MGYIFDDRGNRMSPSHAQKRGVRYRYYVSCQVLQGRRSDAGSVPRVPAPEIESAVLAALQNGVGAGEGRALDPETILGEHLESVVVRRGLLEIRWKAERSDERPVTTVPWSRPGHIRKRAIIAPPGQQQRRIRPIRAEARARLLEAIAKARSWVDELVSGRAISTEVIARREACSERAVRMTLSLAFLDPDLVHAAVDGTLPHGVGLAQLTELPACWNEQHRRVLGSPKSAMPPLSWGLAESS
jgi:site-specific DNA recombinase